MPRLIPLSLARELGLLGPGRTGMIRSRSFEGAAEPTPFRLNGRAVPNVFDPAALGGRASNLSRVAGPRRIPLREAVRLGMVGGQALPRQGGVAPTRAAPATRAAAALDIAQPLSMFSAGAKATRAALGLASMDPATGRRVELFPGAESAARALQGLGGAADLAVAIAAPEGSVPGRSLRAASGATNLLSAGVQQFPEFAARVLPPALPAALNVAGPVLGIGSGALSLAEGDTARGLIDIGRGSVAGAKLLAPAKFAPALQTAGSLVGAAGGIHQALTAEDDIDRALGATTSAASLASLYPPAAPIAVPVAVASAIASLIKGAFFGKEKSHAQREAEEAARDIGAAGGFSQDLSSVKDIESLFAGGLPWMSGYVGGSRTPAVSVDTPLPREFLDLPTTEFNLENGLARVPYLFGTKNPTYPTVLPESRGAALEWIAQHPENLSIQLQSGISQGLKDQFNQPFLSQLQAVLAPLGGGRTFPRIETRPERSPAPPVPVEVPVTPSMEEWLDRMAADKALFDMGSASG